MPSLSSTYLIPAILLNPAFILHLINTFASHLLPPLPTVSVSPHPFMESIGPLPGSTPYFDMHADDQLCWSYTAIMVFVQILAFGRVQDNRVKKKSAKAARLEREKVRKEKLEKLEAERVMKKANGNGHAVGQDMHMSICDLLEEYPSAKVPALTNGSLKPSLNGDSKDKNLDKENTPETDLTETSEEEMMI